jgi:hypothetical protein
LKIFGPLLISSKKKPLLSTSAEVQNLHARGLGKWFFTTILSPPFSICHSALSLGVVSFFFFVRLSISGIALRTTISWFINRAARWLSSAV